MIEPRLHTVKFREQSFVVPNEPDIYFQFCDELEIIDRYWKVDYGDVVMDVGARFGSYTIPALLAGAMRVYAVDPFSEYTDTLMRCVEMNSGLDPSMITLMNMALYDGGEYDIPREIEKSPGLRSLLPIANSSFTTIDRLVEQYSIKRLDWIKIDVEGAELGVLRGAVHTLREHRPKMIIEDHTEIYGHLSTIHSRTGMLKLLKEASYKVNRVPYGGGPGASPKREMWVCD